MLRLYEIEYIAPTTKSSRSNSNSQQAQNFIQMKEATEQQTSDWYNEYHSRKGKDRNDILTNPGVLFQILAIQQSVVKALRALPINRSWKVLDVGCGTGGSLLQFLAFGFAPDCLFGIDIIQERVHEGKKRFPNLNLTWGDASRMNYDSDSFDIVMESTMFIQLADDASSRRIAQEMLRVVKPSGYVMLIDWRYSLRHPEYKALSKKRIASLFGVGLETTQHCRTYGALIPPIGRFLSTYLQPLYFIVQKTLPFCVGQVVTVLQKQTDRQDR